MNFRLFRYLDTNLRFEKSDGFHPIPHTACVGESWSCAKSSSETLDKLLIHSQRSLHTWHNEFLEHFIHLLW